MITLATGILIGWFARPAYEWLKTSDNGFAQVLRDMIWGETRGRP